MRECLHEIKHPDYISVNRVFQLARMILIFVYMKRLVRFLGMNLSRVLDLFQFDFSYSSAIDILNLVLIFGLSASKSNPIKAIFVLWNQGSFYLNLLGKTHFFLYLCTGTCFHFWNHITSTLVAARTIFVFRSFWSTAHSFDFCFYYSFYQSLKVLRMPFINKNVPAKQDPGFLKVVCLFSERIYCHLNRFWFFNRIFL